MGLVKGGYEWAPLFHIPIPGRSNPLIVIPTTYEVIAEVNLVESGFKVRVLGTSDSRYVSGKIEDFLTNLSSELGMEISLELKVKASARAPREYTYVHATNTALEFLGGKLDEDVIEASWRIDSKLGLPQSVFALREAQMIGEPYIWRLNEGYVKLGKVLTAEVLSSSEVPIALNPSTRFVDLLTHLAGVSIVNIFTGLRDGEDVSDSVRLYNALWYAIHGIYPPSCSGKGVGLIFPDLDKALISEVIIE
ncbi:MAG: hypothetical protein QXP80_01820 [Zestosphaera sp.]